MYQVNCTARNWITGHASARIYMMQYLRKPYLSFHVAENAATELRTAYPALHKQSLNTQFVSASARNWCMCTHCVTIHQQARFGWFSAPAHRASASHDSFAIRRSERRGDRTAGNTVTGKPRHQTKMHTTDIKKASAVIMPLSRACSLAWSAAASSAGSPRSA